MTTQYATPLTTAAQIQTWLNGGDDVVGSAGSVVPVIPNVAANNGLGISVPTGRTFDLNGCTLLCAGVLNNTLDTDGYSVLGTRDATGWTIRNGILRGAANRLPSGARANTSGNLISHRAIGITQSGLMEDLTLYDGQAQAMQFNDCDTITLRRLVTPRPAYGPPGSGVYIGHYVDFDTTALTRVTKNITIDSCKFDSNGNDCMKIENGDAFTIKATQFLSFLSIVQDASPYGYLANIDFDSLCTFYSFIQLQNLKRRWSGAAYDNAGAGTVKIRGRFVGDDALILGGLTTAAIVTADYASNQNNADAAHFAALTAEQCVFEGANSHLVPLSSSSWITKSVGVKERATLWARKTRSSHYLAGGTVPSAVKNNVDPADLNALVNSVTHNLAAAMVTGYYLGTRGVRYVIESTTPWTGSGNLGVASACASNVAIDWISDGGASKPFTIDAFGVANAACWAFTSANASKQRLINALLLNASGGSSARGWIVNHASADVEFYGVESRDCTCTNGGGGGRTQAYTAVYLGPGTKATRCSATGSTHGGGFLLDASSTSIVTVEGVRGESCTAGGGGGFMRIGSGYVKFNSGESVACSASAGPGGLSISWSTAAITQSVFGFSGRGNVGSSGQANDVGAFIGTAGSKLNFKGAVLASGGITLAKTGSGNIDYGEINYGSGNAPSVASGTNVDLGGSQSSDPLLVADTTSVALQSTSPCKGAATPRWTLNSERPTLAFDGSWFLLNASNKTTMGARP